MEPEDLLRPGDDDPKAGADELRSIVARAGRRRWRVAAGGVAAALVIGGGAGYALSNHHSPGQTVATSPASNTKAGSNAQSGLAPTPATGGRGASSVSGGVALLPERLQPLFTRTAGSVDIRGFLVTSTIKLPQGYTMPSCVAMGPRFQAEVSTPKMVGTAGAGFAAPDAAVPLSAVSTSVLGAAEGDPTLVVMAATGKNVAQVKVTGFTGGVIDSMAPVDGWVALAGPTTAASSSVTPAKVGTITALSASGQALASQTITSPTVFRGGPEPLSSAAGAQASNGASVVCMGGTSGSGSGTSKSGSGSSGSGTSTGTVPVVCPPVFVSPTVTSGPATSAGGANQSNTGSGSASGPCPVHSPPANGSPGNNAAG
jgi:hypothetical protein